jgi:endonuclease/exonuclease/phosphatase (EEP) superfamily protein YafD
MSTLCRRIGWIWIGLSFSLLLLTLFCFAWQPDHFTAFTVLPIWVWGGLGMIISLKAWYFLRARFSLLLTACWALTLLIAADEARVLTHLGKSPPLPGPAQPHAGQNVLRVITLNCAAFQHGDPSADLAAWKPDIVLLQDAYPHHVQRIARSLFGDQGNFRAHQTNGIVTHWKFQNQTHHPSQRNILATLIMPDGRPITIVNIHLASAATNLRFWDRLAWREHRINRALRLRELTLTHRMLTQTTRFPETPTLLGGDFNAPATDIVHRKLVKDFVNVFATVGRGWGNTYHRRFPIQRIDHLYTTRHFTPVRCRAVATRHSDHRMVVADLILRP